MSDPYVVPLGACADRALVGGKAAGLGLLIRQGFPVPAGLCVTIAAYREALHAAGLDLAESRSPSRIEELRRRLEAVAVPAPVQAALDPELDRVAREAGLGDGVARWAVRSSSSDEDDEAATFSGLYRTRLAVPRERLAETIVQCWASLWTPEALAYRSRLAPPRAAPAMAVVIQPLIAPRAAGVAYSRHPLSGDTTVVVINAVFGLAEPLVSGLVRPDEYLVAVEGDRGTVIGRDVPAKPFARVPGPAGLTDERLPPDRAAQPALSDEEAVALAHLAKRVERATGQPADIEWAMDRRGFWLLQVRAIPVPAPGPGTQTVVWSRANFKETLPELPSPLALSFVREFMDQCIVRPYREAGCVIPPGWSAIEVVRGRPYINVTLFQTLMGQLRGEPRLVTEQMGGEPGLIPAAQPLPWWRLVRAHLILDSKVRAAARRAAARFAELRRLGEAQAAWAKDPASSGLDEPALLDRVEAQHRRLLDEDLTFGIVGGVSRGLYVLGATLARRAPDDWRRLLNASTQGLGTIISANQILSLADLARLARDEPAARAFLLTSPWAPEDYRARLAGTRFLEAFDRYLEEYGHRAVGESDVMVPQFAETPAYLLGIVRGHLQSDAPPDPDAVRARQAAARRTALARIRRAFGWRWHEWLWFRLWYRSLCRFLALREANRHALMRYQAGSRQALLALGRRLAARGLLGTADDLFFLTAREVRTIAAGACPARGGTWQAVVAARRAEREQHARLPAPDTLIHHGSVLRGKAAEAGDEANGLAGLPISAGVAEGPVRLVVTPEDTGRVQPGDILVVPVIDPGLAPLLGLAAGLIAELGGTLSHGAIIVREYGLPALANVAAATTRLQDGERVQVDADRGRVRRLGLG
ncbi:PEP/pyruvate-binding domain-containing protein [Nitrospira sp. Kam-Ns4a]